MGIEVKLLSCIFSMGLERKGNKIGVGNQDSLFAVRLTCREVSDCAQITLPFSLKWSESLLFIYKKASSFFSLLDQVKKFDPLYHIPYSGIFCGQNFRGFSSCHNINNRIFCG